MLFELKATDATSLVVACSVLATVATVASYVPARRAAAIDPMRILRDERSIWAIAIRVTCLSAKRSPFIRYQIELWRSGSSEWWIGGWRWRSHHRQPVPDTSKPSIGRCSSRVRPR